MVELTELDPVRNLQSNLLYKGGKGVLFAGVTVASVVMTSPLMLISGVALGVLSLTQLFTDPSNHQTFVSYSFAKVKVLGLLATISAVALIVISGVPLTVSLTALLSGLLSSYTCAELMMEWLVVAYWAPSTEEIAERKAMIQKMDVYADYEKAVDQLLSSNESESAKGLSKLKELSSDDYQKRLFETALFYDSSFELEKGFKVLHYLAHQGYVPAYHRVAAGFLDGRGVERDLKSASDWAKRGSSEKDADCQALEGILEELPVVVEKAAAHGSSIAMREIALKTECRKEKVRLLLEAGNLGDKDAWFELARMHEIGDGVKKSPVLAFNCYRKAMIYGSRRAAKKIVEYCRVGRGTRIDKGMADAIQASIVRTKTCNRVA